MNWPEHLQTIERLTGRSQFFFSNGIIVGLWPHTSPGCSERERQGWYVGAVLTHEKEVVAAIGNAELISAKDMNDD